MYCSAGPRYSIENWYICPTNVSSLLSKTRDSRNQVFTTVKWTSNHWRILWGHKNSIQRKVLEEQRRARQKGCMFPKVVEYHYIMENSIFFIWEAHSTRELFSKNLKKIQSSAARLPIAMPLMRIIKPEQEICVLKNNSWKLSLIYDLYHLLYPEYLLGGIW